jgi:hypothetical protein
VGLDREMIYRRALALARATGHGLALRLTISNAPELEPLPWECLYDPGEGVHLAASAETPFARALVGPPPETVQFVEMPLRILIAAAAPADAGDRYGLNAIESWRRVQALRESLSLLTVKRYIEIETLAGATRSGLLEAMMRFEPAIVCISADAVLRRHAPQLLLETPVGSGRLTNSRALSALVAGTAAKVVMLLPADGESTASAAALTGIARRLVADTSCAVIVQQHISNLDTFLPEVCRTMASGTPLDSAVSEARRRLLMERSGENKGWESFSLLLPTLSADLLRPDALRRPASGARKEGEK